MTFLSKSVEYIKSLKRVDMGEGNVMSSLLRLCIPAIAMILLHSLMHLADTIFISWLGEKYMSAISYTFPVQIGLFAVIEGIGNGVTALVGRRLGEDNHALAQKTAFAGLALVYLCSLLTPLFFLRTFSDYFFSLLGAKDKDILDQIYLYNIWLSPTAFFMGFSYIVNSIFRCQGDNLSPLGYFVVSNGINILLDPIFIFVFGWGMTGAAAATFIGRVCGTIYHIIKLKSSSKIQMPLITIPKLSMAPLWGSIALIGTPVALNTASVALGVGTINKILTNYYGSIAVAGWMTEIRIEDVGWNGIMGIINALIPFLAFNYGRRSFDRMKKGLKSAIILAAIFSMGLEFIICLVPHPFIGLFRPSAEMEKIVLYALRISFFTFPPTIFICVANALFVATGRSTYGLIIQIMRSLVFRIIFIYIFASCLSLYWVWLFQPCAALAGGVFAIPFYLYVLKKVQKELSVQVR